MADIENANEAPAEQSVADKPVAKIVPRGGALREVAVPLEWPVEFDGKLYETVTVRRVTGFEISAYTVAVATGQDVKPPMVDCPAEVYAALDDDDLYEVDKVVQDFLPRRFREAVAPSQEASGNTSTKSGTPLAAAAPK